MISSTPRYRRVKVTKKKNKKQNQSQRRQRTPGRTISQILNAVRVYCTVDLCKHIKIKNTTRKTRTCHSTDWNMSQPTKPINAPLSTWNHLIYLSNGKCFIHGLLNYYASSGRTRCAGNCVTTILHQSSFPSSTMHWKALTGLLYVKRECLSGKGRN